MKKFIVKVTSITTLAVEAESEDEAIEKPGNMTPMKSTEKFWRGMT